MVATARRVILHNAQDIPSELLDYIMIKEVYHCTPSEYENQDFGITEIHKVFFGLYREREQIEAKKEARKSGRS